MLLSKIKRYIRRIILKKYLDRNKIKYVSLPTVNGKMLIVHDENEKKLGGTPINIEFGKNIFINSGENTNLIGRGNKTVLRTIDNGRIVIGDNLRMSNTVIVAFDEVKIGNDVMIGGGVTIWDSDFHSLDYKTRIYSPFDDIKKSKIIIDDGAFIGAGAYILKGVHIGERAIIGAGAVVSCDVPADEVWAGNPAKCIRKSKGEYT